MKRCFCLSLSCWRKTKTVQKNFYSLEVWAWNLENQNQRGTNESDCYHCEQNEITVKAIQLDVVIWMSQVFTIVSCHQTLQIHQSQRNATFKYFQAFEAKFANLNTSKSNDEAKFWSSVSQNVSGHLYCEYLKPRNCFVSQGNLREQNSCAKFWWILKRSNRKHSDLYRHMLAWDVHSPVQACSAAGD